MNIVAFQFRQVRGLEFNINVSAIILIYFSITSLKLKLGNNTLTYVEISERIFFFEYNIKNSVSMNMPQDNTPVVDI